jgi:DNA-binding NtrC family response regulator
MAADNDDAGESFKVLLVDDEEDFVEVLGDRLEARGMSVETATSGEAARSKAEEQSFDAVVLDMAMPGMDGLQTLEALREVNPDLQVILLTGRATPSQAAQAIKAGALDLMEKPAEIDALLARIEEAAAKKWELEDKRVQDQIDEIMRKRSW